MVFFGDENYRGGCVITIRLNYYKINIASTLKPTQN